MVLVLPRVYGLWLVVVLVGSRKTDLTCCCGQLWFGRNKLINVEQRLWQSLPSCNTDQGVKLACEVKGVKPGAVAKAFAGY